MKPQVDFVAIQRARAEEQRKKKEKRATKSSLPEGVPVSSSDKGKEVAEASAKPKKKRKAEAPKIDETLVDDVVCTLPLDGSFISDPEDLLPEVKKLFLPEDQKRIKSFGLRTITDRGLTTMMQCLQYFMTVTEECRDRRVLIESLEAELAEEKSEVQKLRVMQDEFEQMKSKLQEARSEAKAAKEQSSTLDKKLKEVQAELKSSKDLVAAQEEKIEELIEVRDDTEINVGARIQYQLMTQFAEHGGKGWDAHKSIVDYESLNPEDPLVKEAIAAREKEDVSEEKGEGKEGEEMVAKDLISNP